MFYKLSMFNTSYYIIYLCVSIFWCFELAQCRCYRVWYPMWFKTAISSFRLLQIWCGPVAIKLFCSLYFTLSVTELQLCQVNAFSPLDSRHYCLQPAFLLPIHNKFEWITSADDFGEKVCPLKACDLKR